MSTTNRKIGVPGEVWSELEKFLKVKQNCKTNMNKLYCPCISGITDGQPNVTLIFKYGNFELQPDAFIDS